MKALAQNYVFPSQNKEDNLKACQSDRFGDQDLQPVNKVEL